MSKILEKAATLTPIEYLLLSGAGGAGIYGGMRTLQNTMHAIHKPESKKNVVQLNIEDPAIPAPLNMTSPQSDIGGTAIPMLGKSAGIGGIIDLLKTQTGNVLKPKSFAK